MAKQAALQAKSGRNSNCNCNLQQGGPELDYVADVVNEVTEKYEALKEEKPGFPVAGLVDGVAHLYQVLKGGKIDFGYIW